MTRRRDLEQAVIAAARAVVAAVPVGDEELFDAAFDLEGALRELDKLREVEKPRANRVAPITSHQAAAWVAANTQKSMIGRVFDRIHAASRYDALAQRGGGCTADELIRDGVGSHQTVSARVNELANAGWIVDSGKTRRTSAGREAVVWVASQAARIAVADGTGRNDGLHG